jgi:hypothetical protein
VRGNLALCNDVKVQQCFVKAIQKEVKRYDILGSVCLLYCILAIRLYPTVVPNPHCNIRSKWTARWQVYSSSNFDILLAPSTRFSHIFTEASDYPTLLAANMVETINFTSLLYFSTFHLCQMTKTKIFLSFLLPWLDFCLSFAGWNNRAT